MRRKFIRCLIATLGLPIAAHASDGVLEINQICAANTGCFPGDTAGLPVTITAAASARSFRLTSDLTTASGQQTMINVTANSVTLDLGGFRIAGPNVCNGVPVSSCTGNGLGIGVVGGNDVTVKNGTITGMGNAAVSLTYSARVEGLNVFHCGNGIIVTDLAVVRGNIVTSSGGDGIRCRDHCVVSENSATGHLGAGIDVTSGSVNGNSASLNGTSGARLGRVGYAQNSFSANGTADVAGGHPSGGNYCGDRSCTPRGERRYYLTTGATPAVQALSACAPGFHMASLWEIANPSGLAYDGTLGGSADDAGGGPPTIFAGWVRTGFAASPGTIAGTSNCVAWTSPAAGDLGTRAILNSSWNVPGGPVDPWTTSTLACSNSQRVWCVED